MPVPNLDPGSARNIALTVTATLRNNGYTVTDKDIRYFTCIVLLLIGLTATMRNVLRLWLEEQRAFLLTKKSELVAQSARYDLLKKQQEMAIEFIHHVMDPFDNIFNAITPFLRSTECAGPFMIGITKTLPVKIPSNAVTNFIGVGGFDLFEGVQTYGDLKVKLEDLTWRLGRTVSASYYAQKVSSEIDNQTKFIDAYLDILTLIGG